MKSFLIGRLDGISPMTEITERLSTALADRYRIERHLGEGGKIDGT